MATFLLILAGVLSILLLIYLVFVLIRAEEF